MNYDDIIDLPHHQSSTRKQMPMIKRAAQFAPFAALTGYEEAIEEVKRQTEDFVEVTDDRATILNRRLEMLRHSLQIGILPVKILLTRFIADAHKKGGKYETFSVDIKEIDDTGKNLIAADGTRIPIAEVVDFDIPSKD